VDVNHIITVAIVALCSIVGVYYTLIRRRTSAEKPVRAD
jgi:hypothetical protein